MLTVDARTGFDGDAVDLDPTEFLDDRLPALVDAHGAAAGASAVRLGLVPLTFDVEGEALTFAVDERGRLGAGRGARDELVVALDRATFSDLMQDVVSTFGVQMLARAEVRSGALDQFIEWEPAEDCRSRKNRRWQESD